VKRGVEWSAIWPGDLDQMKRLGASVDWSREYFRWTTAERCGKEAPFVRLHEQGLIYRGAYSRELDPKRETAVRTWRLEHEEAGGQDLSHPLNPLADSHRFNCDWPTTRPETMLGDRPLREPDDETIPCSTGKDGAATAERRERRPPRDPDPAADWAKLVGTGAVR